MTYKKKRRSVFSSLASGVYSGKWPFEMLSSWTACVQMSASSSFSCSEFSHPSAHFFFFNHSIRRRCDFPQCLWLAACLFCIFCGSTFCLSIFVLFAGLVCWGSPHGTAFSVFFFFFFLAGSCSLVSSLIIYGNYSSGKKRRSLCCW